jgi:hypothetical protein
MKLVLVAFMLPIVAIAAPSPDTITKGKLTSSDWQYISQKVATGEQAWIDVVPFLAPKTNREQADQLENALATALPINTKGVLSTLRKLDAVSYRFMAGTNIVCVQKVASEGMAAKAYYNEARLALLDDPDGAKCLWNLEGVWEEVKRQK